MGLFSFFNPQKIEILEKKAKDILELPDDLKALRMGTQVFIVDYAKKKIVSKIQDTFPSNPARATFQILKKLGYSEYHDYRNSVNKSSTKDVWTCGFREAEDRWVWYKNSEPQMTVAFKEAHPNSDPSNADCIEMKIDFCSAKYGTQVIERIQKEGVKKAAEQLNALVLENPYTTIKCTHCGTTENYTIDDLVDEQKKANYDSNFVVCGNCNNLVKLV